MPSGKIKLKYTGIEDTIFHKNPSVKFYYKNYKQYMNLSKITHKIDNLTNHNLSSDNCININIPNIHDFLGTVYLNIKLNKTINVSIYNVINKIELYIGNVLIDTVTSDLIKLNFCVFEKHNSHKIYTQLSKINNYNNYFIPLCFKCLSNTQTYIPLYLLKGENIYIKIYFNGINVNNLIAKEINLINHYIILENELKYNKEYFWFIERMSYIKDSQINCSLLEDINNSVDMKSFKGLCKSLLFTLKDCFINKVDICFNNKRYVYSEKVLKYINFLETNLNNKEYNNIENSIYLYNFSLFKKQTSVSGYVNLDKIDKLRLELKPIKYENVINISVSEVFSVKNFKLTTKVLTDNTLQSPILFIYTNITYRFITNDLNIVITTSDPISYINQNITIPNNILYNGYNQQDRTLLIPSINKDKLILYYCDRVQSILPGILEVRTDVNAFVGNGILNIYCINYEFYKITDKKIKYIKMN